MAEHSSTTGQLLTKTWFDQLEQQLVIEAKRAGLLGHRPMIGNAREFLVKRVLGSFLPPGLGVGSGRVVGSVGQQSRQIDIVIFDTQFPVFRFPGGHSLFPVEGVIATIEVKSRINTKQLHEALDNCLSVLEVSTSIVTSDFESERRRVAPLVLHPALIDREIAFVHAPKTYIFAFRGINSRASLDKALSEWLAPRNYPQTAQSFLIPRVIVTGKAVSITYGDPVRISDAEPYQHPDARQMAFEATNPHLVLLESKTRFGWLATHLLWAIDDRLTSMRTGVRKSISGYLPFEEYWKERVGAYSVISMVDKGIQVVPLVPNAPQSN